MFKKFYQNHKDWFSLFSSAFAGTLLGIVITFGVGNYMENRNKEVMAHKFLVMTLDEINEHLSIVEEQIPSMRRTDSVFHEVLAYYPNEVEDIPDSLADVLVSELASLSVKGNHNISSLFFINNLESLEVFDDLSILADIGKLITYTQELDNTKKEVDRTIDLLREKYMAISSIFFDNAVDALPKLFEDSHVSNLMIYHKAYTESLAYTLDLYKKNILSVKKDLGIEDKDLETTKSERGAPLDTTRKTITL